MWRWPVRPAFVRSSLVTRPLSEQETPAHEQGVEEDGAQFDKKSLGSVWIEDCLKANKLPTSPPTLDNKLRALNPMKQKPITNNTRKAVIIFFLQVLYRIMSPPTE